MPAAALFLLRYNFSAAIRQNFKVGWALLLFVPMLVIGCGSSAKPVAEEELQGGGSSTEKMPQPAIAPPPSPLDEPGLQLPDLATEVPNELRVEVPLGGGRDIRFNTDVKNVGRGELQLRGVETDERDRAAAAQLIERQDSEEPLEIDVGEFIYEETHGHWHLERFLVFELWSLGEDGDRDSLLTSTEKISFCLIDHFPHEEKASPPSFTSCVWQEQGLTPGWTDRYQAALPGQSIDVTALEDGVYLLRMALDPDRLLHEERRDNNTAESLIELRGTSVRILS